MTYHHLTQAEVDHLLRAITRAARNELGQPRQGLDQFWSEELCRNIMCWAPEDVTYDNVVARILDRIEHYATVSCVDPAGTAQHIVDVYHRTYMQITGRDGREGGGS